MALWLLLPACSLLSVHLSGFPLPMLCSKVCVWVCLCVCVFTVDPPVRFQVCELVSRHSRVWRQRLAGVTEKNSMPGGSELRWAEFNFLAKPQSQNYSWGTWAIHVPVGCIHLACLPTSRRPVKTRLGIENNVKKKKPTQMLNQLFRFWWPEISKRVSVIFENVLFVLFMSNHLVCRYVLIHAQIVKTDINSDSSFFFFSSLLLCSNTLSLWDKYDKPPSWSI